MSETLCPYCHSRIQAHHTYCAVCGRDLNELSEKDRELFEVTSEMVTGNMSRFDRFFELTKGEVYGCLATFALTDADREDLSQEVYLKVFKSIGSLREVRGVRGWLKKLTTNCAIDQIKKQKKEAFADLPEDEDFDGDPMENLAVDTVNIPEDMWMNQEKQRLIERAIDALPQNQRIAITAMYLGEMTVAEISLQTGMNQNTIKTNLSRGRNSLRIEIERIERKEGVRLHSVAFTPFLYMLFKSYLAQAAMPEAVSAAVLSELKTATAQGRTDVTGQDAAEHGNDSGQGVSENENGSDRRTDASESENGSDRRTDTSESGNGSDRRTDTSESENGSDRRINASEDGSDRRTNTAESGSEGGKAVSESGSGSGQAVSAGGSTGAKAMALAGRTKILAAVLAVAVAGGAVFAGSQVLKNRNSEAEVQTEVTGGTAGETTENGAEEPSADAGIEGAGAVDSDTETDAEELAEIEIVYETRYFVETYRESNNYGGDSSTETLEEYTYDEMGNVVKKVSTDTSIYGDEESVSQTISEYTYDEMGNLTKRVTSSTSSYYGIESSSESVTEYVYNEAGTLLSSTRRMVSDGEEYSVRETTYDENGNVLTEVTYTEGAFDSKTEYTYDVDGNMLTKISYEENEDEPSSGYEYAYDEAGNQILISTLSFNPSQSTASYTYDEYGNVLTYDITNFTAGFTRYNYHTYTYDENGNILTDVEDSESCNTTTTMTYDEAGRLLTKVMVLAFKQDGEDTYSYSNWDTQTVSNEYTYDADGNVILHVYTITYAETPGVTVTEISTTETVYENGREIQSRYTNEKGGVSEFSYKYDENGNLLTEIYESGSTRCVYEYTYIALDVPVTEE